MKNTLTGRNISTDFEPLYALRADRPDLFALVAQMAGLLNRKAHDYRTDDPSGLGNLLECEKMGVPAWQGILIRMSDKWSRLCTFARQQVTAVKDESEEDTLLDLANYSLLCILARRRAKGAAGEEPKRPWPAGTAFDPKDVSTWPLKEVPSALADAMENPGRRGVSRIVSQCDHGKEFWDCPICAKAAAREGRL